MKEYHTAGYPEGVGAWVGGEGGGGVEGREKGRGDWGGKERGNIFPLWGISKYADYIHN